MNTAERHATAMRLRRGRPLLTVLIGVVGCFALSSQAVNSIHVTVQGLSPHNAIPSLGSSITTQPLVDDMQDQLVTMWKAAALSSLILESAADPEAICQQVSAYVQYATDTKPEDEWREPEQTLKAGRGDCEDFASCVQAACTAKGISTKVYVMTSKVNKRAHAVTISDEGGRMWMSTNGTYEAVLSMSDAKDRICRRMGWWYDDVTVEERGM